MPLSLRALAILEEANGLGDGDGVVFPAPRSRGVLSDMAFTQLLRRLDLDFVPHGLRSSFRDWAAEKTNAPHAVVETALAHAVGNATEGGLLPLRPVRAATQSDGRMERIPEGRHQLMSWMKLSLLLSGLVLGRHEQAEVDLGKLGEVVFLGRYMRPGDEKLAPEELGRRIDDGLVEHIKVQLSPLEGIEEFKSEMRQIEEGMRENIALEAFNATLWENDKVPLASETYLELAKRHVLCGGKPPPSCEEGRRFARVLLAPFMKEAFWEIDWDIQSFTRGRADSWLDSRDPGELQKLIYDSKESPLAWDTLKLICQEVADRGEEDLPYGLLRWYLMANHGHPERPGEGPAPRHRPPKLGYKLRNNEIRHTVDMLALVGMPKTACYDAVAEAVNLEGITIERICREPYWKFDDLGEDAMKRLEPSYYAFLYGPESDAGPSTTTT